MWLWTGEVPADGQGYRVLATGAKGMMASEVRPDGGTHFLASH